MFDILPHPPTRDYVSSSRRSNSADELAVYEINN